MTANEYTRHDWEEALRAILSLIGKCEKVRRKLLEGAPQYALTKNRLKALYIAAALIVNQLETQTQQNG